jgi:hypothetical protein
MAVKISFKLQDVALSFQAVGTMPKSHRIGSNVMRISFASKGLDVRFGLLKMMLML